ncbi:MAG: helix-turn-helix domain-containing protein [Dehalococcoidia bacterium]
MTVHGEARPEVLTVEELARYLRVSRSTLYRLLRDREIPAAKIGGYWRFRRQTIDEWLARNESESLSGQLTE